MSLQDRWLLSVREVAMYVTAQCTSDERLEKLADKGSFSV